MSRDVPYDSDLICDNCGKPGAFDFMGDYYCNDCLTTDKEGNTVVKEMTEMTDEEMIDIVAEKIMKWKKEQSKFSTRECWLDEDNEVADIVGHFNPIESDHDCMLAARTISEELAITLIVTFSPQDNLNACRSYNHIGARSWSPGEIVDHLKHEKMEANCHNDCIRRAMVECMVKSVIDKS